MKHNLSHINLNTVMLVTLLFVISFFKDDITPDYLNTPNAEFLFNSENRLLTVFEFPLFWIKALGYSILFVVLPYYILNAICTEEFARYIFAVLLLIVFAEYVLIFMNIHRIDEAIIPKVNRLFHSPLFTLFFIAAFKINNRTGHVR